MTENVSSRTLKDHLILLLKGMAMGAADVVPGVSGGTIAFITGIYDELLHSLKSLTPGLLLTLKKRGLAAAWQEMNGNFLVAVFGGILISIKTFALVITMAIKQYPILVWAFFFGLILASIYYFASRQRNWRAVDVVACLFGAGLVVAVSLMTPTQLPGHWWMLFIGGFIAICAMILPGISGSFLLLLMGLYPVFLQAINDMDVVALISFGAGCIGGLLCFARFLSWLMDHYHQVTFATLIGFLIGSLNVTWPWKETLVTTVDRHGEIIPLVQKNVLPGTYSTITGADSLLVPAIAMLLTAFILVLSTELISEKFRKAND